MPKERRSIRRVRKRNRKLQSCAACSSQEHVARQLVLGVMDVQLAEWIRPEAMPEIEFAYDGDVFRFLPCLNESDANFQCLRFAES